MPYIILLKRPLKRIFLSSFVNKGKTGCVLLQGWQGLKTACSFFVEKIASPAARGESLLE